MEVCITDNCPIELANMYKNGLDSWKFINNKGNAGLDLRYCGTTSLVIKPDEQVLIGTGIRIWLDNKKACGFVYPRSGLGTKGLVLANTVGVIDSSYQGEIKLALRNTSNLNIVIDIFDRIAQYVIQPVVLPDSVEITSEFTGTTQRGSAGFGSTGTK